MAILTGRIVSYSGPCPCGRYNDITIFSMGMKTMLGPGERVLVDSGYIVDTCVISPHEGKTSKIRKAMDVAME